MGSKFYYSFYRELNFGHLFAYYCENDPLFLSTTKLVYFSY